MDQGIDVSHWQLTIDWAKVKSSGVSFVYIKCTEGLHTLDPHYVAFRAAARSAGLIVGSYHFFHPSLDAETQAQWFLDNATVWAGDLPPALDLEDLRPALDLHAAALGIKPVDLVTFVDIWCAKVGKAIGCTPVIYTSPNYAQVALAHDARLAKYPLWVSHYTGHPAPIVPDPWKAWDIWQWDNTGHVDGVSVPVDLNRATDIQRLVIPALGTPLSGE